ISVDYFYTCIENIDIGGPYIERSCEKNNKHTTILTKPSQYDLVIKEMAETDGKTNLATSREFDK
ncbi:bifunctional phosphoribosylaminoimidazolecarboxamide formyltransferase/IMP cyclohydrolase, partial [Francisella tularensis subsp. holarctica]|nr:bifunctional phosphoribosylaminoimidazolecarboxamide formyltransferase/IMP cyclohydrolase [Francisella tularensis subsp. holarctica]